MVTAAVVFQRGFPDGLDDSKRLTALNERERLFELILAKGTVSIAIASRARIDRMNILRASLWAMSRAVAGLSCRADHVLVDGNMLPPDLACTAEAIVGGDALSVSIAAASIVAKVTRDRLMANVGRALSGLRLRAPHGLFDAGAFRGAGEHGPCPHHRQSFAPVREQQLVLGDSARSSKGGGDAALPRPASR